MLASHYYPALAESKRPTLVFLHGLLGNGEDWSSVLPHLVQFPRLTIDLPGHGESLHAVCTDFDDCCHQIEAVIRCHLSTETSIVLVGYSLGSRLAMYGLAHQLWCGLSIDAAIIEGGHFGLTTKEERDARMINDRHWATRFEQQPMTQVLTAWYQQAVFSSLTEKQRSALVYTRRFNVGTHVAAMLMATSLAKQPALLSDLKAQSVPILYVCGDDDDKFRQLAKSSGLSVSYIRNAGHNAHKEQPEQYAQHLHTFLSHA